MIKTIKIDTIDGVKDLLFNQERDEKIDRVRNSYFYRGMCNADYDLSTSLMRNCGDKYHVLEKPLLDNYIKYVCIEEPMVEESIWKAMIIGQHHGLPTRLLDWTYSPLVALHFATNENNLHNLNKQDCVVWKIDAKELNSKLPKNYQDSLKNKSTFIFSVDHFSSIANTIEQYDKDMGSKSLVTVEPPSIDKRIANQYSFFLVVPSGINNLYDYLDKNTENTVKYVIDKKLRWDIRDLLDQFNMNERMIYPGNDGIAKWLARHYFVK